MLLRNAGICLQEHRRQNLEEDQHFYRCENHKSHKGKRTFRLKESQSPLRSSGYCCLGIRQIRIIRILQNRPTTVGMKSISKMHSYKVL